MATIRENLIARALAISIELRQMGPNKAGGLPNAQQAGGAAVVNHVQYRQSLVDELQGIMKALGVNGIEELEALIEGESKVDWEVRTDLIV